MASGAWFWQHGAVMAEASGQRGGIRILPTLGGFVATVPATAWYGIRNACMLRRPSVRAVYHRQVYFTGIQAMLPIVIAAIGVGVALQSQMRTLLGAGVELNVRMLQLVVLREFAPLVTAFIVLGRSGSAMATELALMKVRGEIRQLYLMGINPGDYLVVPRVWGCVVSVVSLTLLFQLIAAGAGPAVVSLFMEFELAPYYSALLRGLHLQEILLSLAKTITFGAIIAGCACGSGLFVPPQRSWIPQASELSVLRGFILLIAADFVFALLTLLLP
jgi:phospholipid/cholesterol/gamma-HCH transport system permease protein